MNKDYELNKDLEYVKTVLNFNDEDLASFLNVSRMTLYRWTKQISKPSEDNLNNIYNRIFERGIRLNNLKEELYNSTKNKENIILYHGSKKEIIGKPSIKYSEEKKDFGKGFYLGESVKQAISFVSNYRNSNLYIFGFNKQNIKIKEYDVSKERMLMIAYFRGKIDKYRDSKVIKKILKDLEDVDVVIAPIADNTMYSILSDFISGEITDLQCINSLSANRLGKQYVFLNDKVINNNLKLLEKCYICDKEKEMFESERIIENETGRSKVKIAKREYAGKGLYIEGLLK